MSSLHIPDQDHVWKEEGGRGEKWNKWKKEEEEREGKKEKGGVRERRWEDERGKCRMLTGSRGLHCFSNPGCKGSRSMMHC